MGKVEVIVVSHGRFDHARAMRRALDLISLNNGGRSVPTYMQPGMYGTRALKSPAGMRLMDDVPSTTLIKYGAEVVNTTEPQHILEDMFYVSGEIPRVTSFEKGLVGQYRRWSGNANWEEDSLIMDERFVAVNVNGNGLIVFRHVRMRG